MMNSDRLLYTSGTIGSGEGCVWKGVMLLLRSRSFTSFVVFPHGYLISSFIANPDQRVGPVLL